MPEETIPDFTLTYYEYKKTFDLKYSLEFQYLRKWIIDLENRICSLEHELELAKQQIGRKS